MPVGYFCDLSAAPGTAGVETQEISLARSSIPGSWGDISQVEELEPVRPCWGRSHELNKRCVLQKKKRNTAVWCPTVRALSFLSVIGYA